VSDGARAPLALPGGIRIARDEIEVSWARSGGPGGQNVNKVASKAVVRFAPAASRSLSDAAKARILAKLEGTLTREGEIVIAASEYRDAPRNLEAALARLARVLGDALRVPRPRVRTKPTRGSRERRLESKRARSETKRQRRESE